MSTLDARLLDAHDKGDQPALVTLYTEAANRSRNDPDAEGFYLTHAYVFALELGDSAAKVLRARLVAMGRDTPEDHSVSN